MLSIPFFLNLFPKSTDKVSIPEKWKHIIQGVTGFLSAHSKQFEIGKITRKYDKKTVL